MADLAITPGEVAQGAGKVKILKSAKAGVVIDAGETVHVLAGVALLGDNVDAAGASVKGMALNSAGVDQPVDVLEEGEIIVGATAAIAVGTVYLQSTNGGKVAPAGDPNIAAADFVTVVGVGLAGNRMAVGPLISGAQLP